MLARMRSHVRQNVVGYLALFVALGGTSAYAANEWTGTNIVDESLTGADVRGKPGTSSTPSVNGSLTTHEIAGQPANAANGSPFIQGSLTTWDIADGTLRSADVSDNSLAAGDLAPSSVNTSEVADNSLGGADVLESSLGKVPDADKLDGIDSTGFVQGRGTLLSNRIVFVPTEDKVLLTVPGLGQLEAACSTSRAQSNVFFINTTAGPVDFWNDISGRRNGFILSEGHGTVAAVVDGESLNVNEGATIGVGVGNDPGPRRVATLHVFAFQSGDGAPCGFQAQGTLWVSP
jgi:hypothetical protein